MKPIVTLTLAAVFAGLAATASPVFLPVEEAPADTIVLPPPMPIYREEPKPDPMPISREEPDPAPISRVLPDPDPLPQPIYRERPNPMPISRVIPVPDPEPMCITCPTEE